MPPHVIQLPMFQSLRVYHAHSASITSISISPYPPPLPTARSEAVQRLAAEAAESAAKQRPASRQSGSSPAAASRRPKEPSPVPNIPSNNIHVATSSMDGNVCVFSLVDTKDVHLRNFARPVQAVALSPDYRNDRTYISGGLAGQLILTNGAQPGRSTSTTVGTAAATASGWLGSMGLGANTGKDSILHSGEGTISTIKWSLSGKYVVWLNEHGVKIMRSKLHLESGDSDDAWKRIGHIDRPQTDEWETMASVWKGRAEWIDEQAVETDDGEAGRSDVASTPASESLRQQAESSSKKVERLVVGWGGTIWIIHVHPGSIGTGKRAGERSIGRAEIAKHLRMDCIISGISLYTQNLLLVLAYVLPDDDDDEDNTGNNGGDQRQGHKAKTSTGSEPSGGIRRRQNHLPPELRLIDLASQAEVDKDGLSVSRYERLSSGDYHLGVLPAQNAASAVASSKGALEAIAGFGSDMWNAAINPRTLFSSGASIRSRNSGDDVSSTQVPSSVGGIRKQGSPTVHPNLVKPGVKIFIHSPFDFILATKRDLGDHLGWLLEHQEYRKAWELLDEHPEIMAAPPENLHELVPSTPDKKQTSPDELFDDASSVMGSIGLARHPNSSAQKEKRRIGELWIRELIEGGNWAEAGKVCSRVLGSSDRWEKWVWTFAGADKFDEITNYIPSEPMYPPIPGTIYEVVLNHYIQVDKLRFRELLDRWSTDLFDIKTVSTALENQLKYRDVREDSIEGGEKGRDWKIVMESLARLHEANGRYRESLKCYIRLQDADSAFRLIRDNHLADAVADDIPSFIGLRVPQNNRDLMGPEDYEAATSEAITLLVDEAQHGLVKPSVVVSQLLEKDYKLYLFFYLRGLYKGEGIEEHSGETRDRLLVDSQSLVDEFADLAVSLFAKFERPLLMSFLKSSTSYAFEKAVQECEKYKYDDELVHLYSKTGQMKRALYLIIDRLKDVKKAIEFAKQQDDPDLWDDLLNYSMDKPSFIRGLLEEVGTAINPIKLVRRIPEGLEIEGLREGLKHIMKEHEIQYSISSGVARVLRSEVAAAQNDLRTGQRKGIKFEVVIQSADHVDVQAKDVPHPPVTADEVEDSFLQRPKTEQPGHTHEAPKPGHCAQCNESFTEYEMETLVGFACGHVFHLSHLLELLYPSKKLDSDYGLSSEESIRSGYRVGSKVTHARLLKDHITEGCPVCTHRSVDVQAWDLNRNTSPILRLPPEIRNKIYRILLSSRRIHVQHDPKTGSFHCVALRPAANPWAYKKHHVLSKGMTLLAAVCRQLYHETDLIPYGECVWSWQTPGLMERFLVTERRLGALQRRAVREVCVRGLRGFGNFGRRVRGVLGGLEVVWFWEGGSRGEGWVCEVVERRAVREGIGRPN
ncbi:Vacuolar protein sorting-associated protein 41-like protein [Colletotrichum chlorophyti]|uniref:Vacuolar protein sorting-associated protein 41-like protein n=1 Tax=Colletotrichum chlorophyti TaxID=708187 RepID=A0A1Q8RXC7_9PEZI|nr:Vacuolar protein sorting-associated protein 41-like protein [Colletotrichum chlorophyti]